MPEISCHYPILALMSATSSFALTLRFGMGSSFLDFRLLGTPSRSARSRTIEAILFPGADKSHALELADRIMNELKQTSFYGADVLPSGALTISIGAASFPEDASDSRSLIGCADAALYAAKESHKNNIKVFGAY